ncbi:haloacid dehalogenase type II [Pseudomonadota bacterium]
MRDISEYKVLTFDCYGTLIDWETGIWDALQPVISANGRSGIHRDAALEVFASLESRLEAESPGMPYPEILSRVHHGIAVHFELGTTKEADQAFGNSVPFWPAFPDTADALRYLKHYYKLVILSNVHREGFAASNRKLGVDFDAIYTAQDIESYKPDPANFSYLLDKLGKDLGLEKGDVLHTAQSLFHDHVPARSFGLATAWIDRQRLSESGNWGATASLDEIPKTDYVFHSMAELAAAVAASQENRP